METMSSAFNTAIGARLKRVRKLHGLTQSQLAARMSISFQQVQKYEAGVNTLSFERVCTLSALLGVPLADWAKDASAAVPQEAANGRQELSLLQAFHAIGSDERRTLLCQLARALAGA
jgi:transcriptional regulator with XRE-family HTH domain